jgi:hypothetical protein
VQRLSPSTIVVFAVVAATGLVDIAQPLEGDQSLFLIGAKEMAHGAVLYRDFWDLKQPGIFDFYYLAGVIGGFTALSVHILELIYLLAFAGVATYATSRSKTLAPAATLVPLFAIAPYYIVSTSLQQVQVEALAGFPIFVSAWLACEGTQCVGRARFVAFLAAGFAAGCALVLKLVFLPILIALFITAVAFPNVAYRPSWRGGAGAVAAFLGGAALPILATLATLARGGALGIALDTWLTLPPRIVATLPHQQLSILFDGVKWLVHGFGALIVLAIAGLFMLARARNVDALTRTLAVWIAGAIVTILAQRTSWWEYQWLLLSVPLGTLAAAGFVTLVRAPRGFANTGVLVLAALFALVPARVELQKIGTLARYRFAVRSGDRERYRANVSPTYAGVLADAALLPPGAGVYVMGNPMYYVVTGRTQPIALNGWSLELALPEQRAELVDELRTRAPQFVYVSKDDDGSRIAMARSPEFAAYFARHYHVFAKGTFGTLYRFSVDVPN